MATTSASPPRGANAKKKPASVTPTGNDGINQRMNVDKDIVDELLLVCSVIGSTPSDPSNENQLVPVTDCLNWLQDLQRALRRDDDTYRPISLLIGKWKVVQQKLLPLVMTCRYNSPMLLTIVKILIILTKPISETTQKAGRMVIDTRSGKVPEDVIKEQIKLRDNALAQSDMLMEYKRAFVQHPSHLPSKESKDNKKGGGLLSILVSLLPEALSKTGTARTDADHMAIELVLTLFRNLLSAERILVGSPETSHRSAQLHQELINLFEQEDVLDIVLVIAQEIESRENAQYNLLLMELLHFLLRNQDPTSVARYVQISRAAISKSGKENIQQTGATASTASVSTAGKGSIKQVARSVSAKKSSSSGSLRAQLNREKQKFSGVTTARHSHFGGTLMIERPGGKRQYISAALADQQRAEPPVAVKRRKNRRTEPFIGAGRTLASHKRSTTLGEEGTPTAIRAQRTLHNFCTRFVRDCYGPVMKSLKNEFRRDSARLEAEDKVRYFRIIWFFCQWWRVSGGGRKANVTNPQKEDETGSQNTLGQLIFTMDVFTFNLVLNATDAYHQHKKHTQLAQTVSLYNEMMHMLLAMYQSKDPTENIMALGLLDRLFYGNEPLDRFPQLLSRWKPGTSTREYLCDLVELCHVTLKLLEANAQGCLIDDNKKKSSAGNEAEKKKNDAVSRMKAATAEFDVNGYIARKIVSNQLVFMYTHLLSQYVINAPHVNHHVVAFFMRICKLKIVASEDPDADYEAETGQHILASKTVTLEPMLYNIQLIIVLNQILNDASITGDKEYSSLLAFATFIMGQFAGAAKKNPVLYAECLFRHPAPHRFCELSTNLYVNEELRMIAERELLLEEQRRLQSEYLQQEGEDDESEGNRDEGRTEDAGDDGESPGTGRAPRNPVSAADEETEWIDDTESETSSPKVKSTKSVANKAKEQNTTKALDDDEEEDEKWNDRRPFIPKRQSEASDTVSSDTERGVAGSGSSTSDSPVTAPAEKKHRIQRQTWEDSSDEEDFGESGQVSQPAPGAKSSGRMVIDDDDDD